MHLDWARLWEAVVGGDYEPQEFEEFFDSNQLYLTKGPREGSLVALVVGNFSFIDRPSKILMSWRAYCRCDRFPCPSSH